MIKNNISKILGERRMTIKDFATSAGIAYQTAHSLYHESNKQIHFDVMDKICSALDVQPGELFTQVNGEGGKLPQQEAG